MKSRDDLDITRMIPRLGLLSTIAILLVLILSGCVEHRITAPQLDAVAAAVKAPECRPPALPPVPADVVIDIKGDRVTANAGGETVLRGYVSCRSWSTAAR